MIPIIIGGCDRSGTTLLGALIGAHSKCLTIPESQFKIDVFASLKSELNRSKKFDVLEVLKKIKNHRRFKLLWEPLELDFNTFGGDSGNSSIIQTYRPLLEWIMKEYGRQRLGKSNCQYWVDHTPSNIMYAKTLSLIFPDAKFIHIIRDGRGIAASVLPLNWGSNTIIEAAHWWSERLGLGLAMESFLGKDNVIRIRYEDILMEAEKTLKNVCAAIGIDFQEDMLKGDGYKPNKYLAKSHALVGKKPFRSRARAWEKALTPRQIEIFESYTGELLDYLGYNVKYGIEAKNPGFKERLRLKIYSFIRSKILNRCSKKRWVKKSLKRNLYQ